MAATPKRKLSSGRQGRRRTQVKLIEHKLIVCKKCGSMKRAHFICPVCGAD
ncbi:MAG TPA: 50S ribosomal protein L32 [Patescibacteria group bacterium]